MAEDLARRTDNGSAPVDRSAEPADRSAIPIDRVGGPGEHSGIASDRPSIPNADPAESPIVNPWRDRLAISHGHRETFDRELLEIKERVFRMGALVETAIEGAVASLVDQDVDEATRIANADGAINEAQKSLSRLITATIATQAPVARDLRFLLALDRVTYELERMGDHAAHIARQARKLGAAPIGPTESLRRLGELANALLHDVLRALVDLDQAEARRVAVRDDEIDGLYHAYFDKILERMRGDPTFIDAGTRLLFAAHDLERIGDRATNIAEDVVFLATGEIEDLNP